MNKVALYIFGFLSFVLLFYGMYLLAISTDPAVAAAAITASTTIIVSTGTISIGRYFEKRKELEALHREKRSLFMVNF